MPLALYTIKDPSISGIFVIFICSAWPMLINTAFGVSVAKREWLNVAATLQVSPLRKAFLVILPAATPTIFVGMRISMGLAWLVIGIVGMLIDLGFAQLQKMVTYVEQHEFNHARISES